MEETKEENTRKTIKKTDDDEDGRAILERQKTG